MPVVLFQRAVRLVNHLIFIARDPINCSRVLRHFLRARAEIMREVARAGHTAGCVTWRRFRLNLRASFFFLSFPLRQVLTNGPCFTAIGIKRKPFGSVEAIAVLSWADKVESSFYSCEWRLLAGLLFNEGSENCVHSLPNT